MPGPERTTFDEEILRRLVERKIKEQIPWKEMPTEYMSMLPEDSTEEKPDYRVLKREMMKNADVMVMPERVHKGMRSRLKHEFEKADMGIMLMDVLMSKYSEWNLLHSKFLRYVTASSVVDEPLDGVAKFTPADTKRKDKLADDVVSYIFRIGELMRGMSLTDNSLFVMLRQVRGEHTGMEPSTDQQQISIDESIRQVVDEVSQVSKQMLGNIGTRHKELGIGKFRPLPEEEEPED